MGARAPGRGGGGPVRRCGGGAGRLGVRLPSPAGRQIRRGIGWGLPRPPGQRNGDGVPSPVAADGGWEGSLAWLHRGGWDGPRTPVFGCPSGHRLVIPLPGSVPPYAHLLQTACLVPLLTVADLLVARAGPSLPTARPPRYVVRAWWAGRWRSMFHVNPSRTTTRARSAGSSPWPGGSLWPGGSPPETTTKPNGRGLDSVTGQARPIPARPPPIRPAPRAGGRPTRLPRSPGRSGLTSAA